MSIDDLDSQLMEEALNLVYLSEEEGSDWSTLASNDSSTSWHTVDSQNDEDDEEGPFENEFDGLMYLLERHDARGVRKFFFQNHRSYSPTILSTELEDYGPPLMYAAERGQMYAVRTLIQEGADVSQQSTTTDYALPISCMEKGSDSVSLFLLRDCEADINSADEDELLNAAMMALSYDRADLFCKMLTWPGMNLRHLDSEGNDILHCAVLGGNFSCAKKILGHPGIEVNSQNLNGETPLMLALTIPKRKKFAMLLLDNPLVDVNIPNYNGLTPLMVACKNGMAAIVRKIATRQGVDLHAECKCGHTAYDLVKRKKGSQRLAEILKSVGGHLRPSQDEECEDI